MKNSPQPFGTLLGYAPGNIPVYSSDYDSVDPAAMPDRHAYRHHVNGIYTGYKWQCVEFARRWLLENKGYVFEDIAMAYDIFRLHQVKVIDAVKANSNSQTLS
jgi:glutathionylspermidine amidase/synthetase